MKHLEIENSSEYSQKTSRDATFNQILKKLESHEMALEGVFKKSDSLIEKMNSIMLLISENQAMTTLKFDKLINYFTEYVTKQREQNSQAIEDFTKMINTIVKSQNAADDRSDESLKAGMALVKSIEQTKIEGVAMIKAVHEQSNRALELGERALDENTKALQSFEKGLEGYATERDKKAEEITLVNVEKLFRELIEQKGLGTYTKYKKI